jgi:hypothetical protein
MIADSLASPGTVPVVLDSADLVSSNDAADYRSLPVLIKRNQSPCAVVQVPMSDPPATFPLEAALYPS